jgi:hypothetical protein
MCWKSGSIKKAPLNLDWSRPISNLGLSEASFIVTRFVVVKENPDTFFTEI